MDVKEIGPKLQELEKDLFDRIQQFRKETGLNPEVEVRIDPHVYVGERSRSFSYEVRCRSVLL